jgi:hypothetical protein
MVSKAVMMFRRAQSSLDHFITATQSNTDRQAQEQVIPSEVAMKGRPSPLLLLLFAVPLAGFAGERLIPAGSLISCTVSEPRLSSKTASVGDPVLCQVSRVELYGRSTLPSGSYLEGRFEDYKDPGHFVGKGWMELKFDRMIIEPDTVIPMNARVVSVPGYNVDRQGRILGKGHAVRDTIEWAIPILWPIDLINLPRRGPRPSLKEETRLTLKIMDDFGVPAFDPAPPRENPGLMRRENYQPPAPEPPRQQAVVQTYVRPVYVQPPPPPVYYYYAPPPMRVYYPPPPPPVRRAYAYYSPY